MYVNNAIYTFFFKQFTIASPVTTLVTTCKVCKAKKRYAFHNKDYELFNDKAAIKDENTL